MAEKTAFDMNDSYCEQDTMQYIKPYMFIKGYAMGRRLPQTMLALPVARKLHDGQYRKDGMPYFTHPLKVCSTLISYGIDDDVTLAAALLHDVLEDCGELLPNGGQSLVEEYGVSTEVVETITLLSKRSGLNDQELGVYFRKIEKRPRAALIKLADRLHNSGNLYTFTDEKMAKYLRETKLFLLPMASYCKKYYPQYSNAFSILKTNITALNSSMEAMLERVAPMTE